MLRFICLNIYNFNGKIQLTGKESPYLTMGQHCVPSLSFLSRFPVAQTMQSSCSRSCLVNEVFNKYIVVTTDVKRERSTHIQRRKHAVQHFFVNRHGLTAISSGVWTNVPCSEFLLGCSSIPTLLCSLAALFCSL